MVNFSLMESRRLRQWFLAPIVVVVIALGWKYPLFGFAVPVVILMGVVGSIFNGRYVCGNLCPRGAFFDSYFSWRRGGRMMPGVLRNRAFRWFLFVAMMGFMAYSISRDPGSWRHWGFVFWLMCTATTAAGVVLIIFLPPRAWCAVCPVGTLQGAIGGDKNQLLIDGDLCKECELCEKKCPLSLSHVKYIEHGRLAEPDCLKCGECVAACPTKALFWHPE